MTYIMTRRTCKVCGWVFLTTVTYDERTDTIIESAHECPKCAQWASIELLSYHLWHNLTRIKCTNEMTLPEVRDV